MAESQDEQPRPERDRAAGMLARTFVLWYRFGIREYAVIRAVDTVQSTITGVVGDALSIRLIPLHDVPGGGCDHPVRQSPADF